MGDLRLGVISVVAPNTIGTFAVALAVDASDPTFRSFLLIDDGTPLGQTLPGNGDLSVTNSSLTVAGAAVPEPSAWLLGALGIGGGLSLSARSRGSAVRRSLLD